jgi:outer membrane protein assembly factor BamB
MNQKNSHKNKVRATFTVALIASLFVFSLGMLVFAEFSDEEWQMQRHDAAHTGYTSSQIPTFPIQLWNYTLESNVVSVPVSPAVAGGFVYAVSNDYNLQIYKVMCLEDSTGRSVWNFSAADSVTSTPAVVGGRVYVGSTDGYVYCINAADGAKVWNSTIRDDARETAAAPITVYGNRLFLESSKGNVFCFDAAEGTRVWNYSTRGDSHSGYPAVADGKVFAGNDDGELFCLDAANGQKIWNHTTDGWVSSPTVTGGFVYVGSGDGNIYCLSEATGDKVWNYTTWFNSAGPSHGYYWGNGVSAPAVANGQVYVGSTDFSVFCLDAALGKPIWNFTTRAEAAAAPAIADGAVLVGSYDGGLYCLNATNGVQIWVQDAGVFSPVNAAGSVGSPAIVNGVAYVVGNGILQAYGAELITEPMPSLLPAVVAGLMLVMAIVGLILLLVRIAKRRQKA